MYWCALSCTEHIHTHFFFLTSLLRGHFIATAIKLSEMKLHPMTFKRSFTIFWVCLSNIINAEKERGEKREQENKSNPVL